MPDLHASAETAAALRQIEKLLAAVCESLEPDDLLARHAVELIDTAARLERYVAGARTLAVWRVLESKVWRDDGAKSPQRWLAAKLGITVGQAGRIVATAERVQAQPKTQEAMRNGQLSDDEADAVSGATEAEPEAEEDHRAAATGGEVGGRVGEEDSADAPGPSGGSAGAGAGAGGRPDAGSRGRPGPGGRRASIEELRRRRERAKAKADADEQARQQRLHRERNAWRGPTAAGGWEMRATTSKEAGLRFDWAWKAATEELRAERKAAGLPELTFGQLASDALIRMADKSMATGAAGAAATSPPGPRYEGIVIVDLAALRRGQVHAGETCEIPGVGPVPVGLARDLLGDSFLSLVISEGVDVRSVTRLGRTIPSHLRTALYARAAATCETPGCTAATGLEVDHGIEWQFGGTTELANLRLHCWTHHQDKTHHGMRLVGEPGRWAWVHVDQLPADPAAGPLPTELVEHLLPPRRTASAAPRPEPPTERPPEVGVDPPPPHVEGEQLHLQSV